MAKMTHRERVVAACSHEQPDMVPIDLGGTRDSSIVVEGYERLKAHFGVEDDNPLCDRMMRVVKVDEKVLQGLDIDVRWLFPGGPTKPTMAAELGPGKWRDAWGVERVHPEGSYYYDQLTFPLSGDITISDIVNYPWPDPDDPGFVAPLKERLRWVRENTDCAIILTLPAPFVHISQYIRGFEDWYMDMALNPKLAEALYDAVLEITTPIARAELKEVGQDVDVIICADDLGAQQALQFSHDAYVKYIKPRHAKYFQMIHDLSPAKLLFHTCGSVRTIMDDLIEMGVDILNPVQPTAWGMEPEELNKLYGGKIVFWGAIDTQHVLPRGSVADVKKAVEETIETLGEGGGYVLTGVHNIQPDVPTDNLVAMFEHAREYVPSFAK